MNAAGLLHKVYGTDGVGGGWCLLRVFVRPRLRCGSDGGYVVLGTRLPCATSRTGVVMRDTAMALRGATTASDAAVPRSLASKTCEVTVTTNGIGSSGRQVVRAARMRRGTGESCGEGERLCQWVRLGVTRAQPVNLT